MPVRFAAVRHTFNEKDTAIILRQAKFLKVTISQIANAALFVALMNSYPANTTSKLNYIISLNIRNDLGLAKKAHYGNAIAALFGMFDCSGLSENVLNGDPQTKEDAGVVLDMASTLSDLINARRGDAGLADILAFSTLMKARPPPPPPLSLPDLGKQPPVPMGIVSDGVLERFVQRRYTGPVLSLDVESVLMANFDCGSVLQNRTHTFRDCLTLTSAFNPYIWRVEEVETVMRNWTRILRFTLDSLAVSDEQGNHLSDLKGHRINSA
jgi:hypothetical protein